MVDSEQEPLIVQWLGLCVFAFGLATVVFGVFVIVGAQDAGLQLSFAVFVFILIYVPAMKGSVNNG